MAMVLTVTISGLTVGRSYNIYQYNAMSSVPNSQFNANAANALATTTFTASDLTHSFTVDIVSSDFAVFRTVLTTAQ